MKHPVDYFSYSQLSTYRQCGEKYRRRYVEGEKSPASLSMIIGSVVHKVAEINFTNRMATDVLLPMEAVADVAADHFEEMAKEEIHFTEEERQDGIDQLKASAKDMAIEGAKTHASNLAPLINAIAVESKFLAEVGLGVPLMAIIDVVELTEYHEHIVRDLKVRGKAPPKNEALTSPQLSFYDLVMNEIAQPVDRVAIDTIVKGKSIVVQTAQRDQEDRSIMLGTIERSLDAIGKGVFVPADPSQWWCSKAYCSYAPTCPFFAGRKQI